MATGYIKLKDYSLIKEFKKGHTVPIREPPLNRSINELCYLHIYWLVLVITLTLEVLKIDWVVVSVNFVES